MKERPILFSGPMIRAILAGTKTQTRRVVKLPKALARAGGRLDEAVPDLLWGVTPGLKVPWQDVIERLRNPWLWPDEEGVRLWVREAFRFRQDQDHLPPSKIADSCWYAADPDSKPSGCNGGPGKLRPSIFMPRRLSRITLEITDVRAERLQEIPAADVGAEGFYRGGELGKTRACFATLWDRLNAKRGFSWETNPWVWVVEFRRVAG